MSTAANPPTDTKVTIQTFREKKTNAEPITMLTAYDYSMAYAIDQAGIDSILVGDSLGMVVLGYETTLPVTMEEMLHHCRAVARGARRALLIGDMPFMSYQDSESNAVRNAGRFLKEAGMDAVKLEGGQERAGAVRRIVEAGIPVCGHIGLTPQSVHQLGGFRTQGRSPQAALKLVRDAEELEQAGCFALVLESIPDRLAALISSRLSIPTIGIGAGLKCDGQVLVTHDLLGMFDRFTPRFVKKYANLHEDMARAFTEFSEEIVAGKFPADEHSFHMTDEAWAELTAELGKA